MVVAGDLIADEFIYGRIDRVSREAPVLILKYDSTEIVPGGAGNAAANAAALGARVRICGLTGRDAAGRRLMAALSGMADVSAVVRSSRFVTPVKTRILAGGTHSAKQQVVRIDRAGGRPAAAQIRQVERSLGAALRRSDVVRLGRQHVKGGTVSIKTQKTGSLIDIPVLVELSTAIEAMPGSTAMTFLVTEYGKGFTAAGFGQWFRHR